MKHLSLRNLSLRNFVALLLWVAIWLGASTAAAPTAAQARLTRPDSTVTLPKRIRLGRSSQGYTAKLDVVCSRFGEHTRCWLTLATSSPPSRADDHGNWLFMKKVHVSLDDSSFELDVIPEHRRGELQTLWDSRRPEATANPEAEMLMRTSEERSFSITREQLLSMAAAASLEIRIQGSTARESEHTIKPKELRKLSSGILALVN